MKKFVWKDHADREPLPIDAHLEEIFCLLEDNQVVIIEAETGAGKTTRIPQMLFQKTGKMIHMTQPRRPVVRWMAKRIAYELKDVTGGLVGWKLFGDDPVVSKRTRCLLRVDQALANWIRRHGRLPKGIIIVDEAHERHVTTDTLLILLKRLLPESPDTKVIITSATIDTEKFSKYFENAPVLRIQGRCYPVDIRPYAMMRNEHHTQGAIKAAQGLMDDFLGQRLHIQDKHNELASVIVNRGTVLVFLPGEEDINSAVSYLERYAAAQNLPIEVITLASESKNRKSGRRDDSEYRIEIFPCHGKLTSVEQDRSQGPDVPANTLRIVCTTDISRTSATFPRVVGVIDSLQIKRPFSDHKGVAHLDKIQVSRAEADQAKGRAGRTQPGFYIPISFEGEYGRLSPWPLPAILREPLSSVVLQVVSAGINPRDCDYIDSPDPKKIDATIKRLQKLGALDANERITEIGELLVQFPIDPERAKSLITGSKLGVLAETVIAAACIEHEGIFWSPKAESKVEADQWLAIWYVCWCNAKEYGWRKDYTLADLPRGMTRRSDGVYEIDPQALSHGARDLAEVAKKAWTEVGSDFEAMVHIFRAFKNYEFESREKGLPGRVIEDELYGWCRRNFVNFKKIRAVELTVKQIREEIANSPLQMKNGIFELRQFDGNALSKAIASGLIDYVGVKAERGYGYSSPSGGFQVGHQSACPENAPLVLIGGIRKVAVKSRRTDFIHLADLAAPLKPEWLEEIMPQFCSYNVGLRPFYSLDTDACMSTTEVFCNGQKVGERIVEDRYHVEAPELFARWLARRLAERQPLPAGNRLERVFQANIEQQRQAEWLNARVGTRFYVYPEAELVRLFEEKLNLAQYIGEIDEPADLKLPPLDEQAVQEVLAGHPEQVEFLGRMRNLTYRQGYAPYITLAWKEIIEQNAWVRYPDEACVLPSGKVVEIHFYCGSYERIARSGKEVRILVRNHLSDGQWGAWQNYADKPEVLMPDAADFVPPVVTAVYGWCPVTLMPLYAYGALIGWIDSGGRISLSVSWYRSLEEAEKQRDATQTVLEKHQANQRKARALAAIAVPKPEDLDAIVPEVAEIEGGYGFIKAVENRSFYSGTTVSFQVEWTTDKEYAEDHRQMAVKRLDALQAERRERIELKSSKAQAAELQQKMAEMQEEYLARKVDYTLSSRFSETRAKLTYLPSTSAEIKNLLGVAQSMITQFEQAISALREKQEKVRELIRKEYARCPICGSPVQEIDFSMAEASPQDASSGAVICGCFCGDGRIERVKKIIQAVADGYEGDQSTCSRNNEAAVYARTAMVGELVLAELLIFHKWGEWNCRLQVYPDNFQEGLAVKTQKIFMEPEKFSGKVTMAGRPVGTSALSQLVVEERQEAFAGTIGNFTHHAGKDFRCECGKFASLTGSEKKKYQRGEEAAISCICGRKGIVRDVSKATAKSVEDKDQTAVQENSVGDSSFAEALAKAMGKK